MNKGDQYYLELEVFDENDIKLDNQRISSVKNVIFTIGEFTKKYLNPNITDEQNDASVTYDETNQCFKIWMTQEETFKLDDITSIQARVKYINNVISGTEIIKTKVFESLNKDVI